MVSRVDQYNNVVDKLITPRYILRYMFAVCYMLIFLNYFACLLVIFS